MTGKIRTISGVALALSLAIGWSGYSHKDQLGIDCANSQATVDTRLPVSHPQNRCAMGNKQDVSWSSWLSGKGQGMQFHFLDLLELLSRNSDTSTDQLSSN
ncbi:hypothetical protein [Lacimicrobium sp. SS2-24]|uniref:hypothetical protein n=1 Tax=Lacimicrobium sp. SS2-24 TaxID=2005569 RepID=UPI000B4A6A5A|nr:hypothetical protein [Lacimicrobium sp. SS2-24]